MPSNHYTGSSFTGSTWKVYNGSSHVEKPVKRWTGSAWETVSETDRVIDDFNDRSLSPYGGSVAQWGTTTSVVREGTASLVGNFGAGESRRLYSLPGMGLDYYPQQGDTIRYWTRLGTTDAISQFHFGKENSNTGDHYEVYVDRDNTRFGILKDAASLSVVGMVNFTPQTNTWYEVEIVWGTGGSITARLLNASGSQLARIDGSDNQFNGRGIGFRTRTSAYFDHVRVIS